MMPPNALPSACPAIGILAWSAGELPNVDSLSSSCWPGSHAAKAVCSAD
jgi:hypothetical protein